MLIVWIFLIAWWIVWLVPVPRTPWWKTLCYGACMTFLLLYAGIATMGVYYDGIYPWYSVRHVDRQEIPVHMGPGTGYGVVATIQADQRVRVIHTNGNWRKIANASMTGWVPAECLVR